MALAPDDVLTLAAGAAVAVSGVIYKATSKTGRALRRALARIEAHERYARKLRRLLDEAGVPEARWKYPPALRYLDGGPDPHDDQE